jgi:hypothetical protein
MERRHSPKIQLCKVCVGGVRSQLHRVGGSVMRVRCRVGSHKKLSVRLGIEVTIRQCIDRVSGHKST